MSPGMVGLAWVAFVCTLCSLAVMRGRTPEEADASLRALGTLMTLVCGVFSALWWHQSATLSDRLLDLEQPDGASAREANVLNGAAATMTALALIAGVFSGLSWRSLEGRLAGACFVALLAISGDDIRRASAISVGQRIHARSVLGLVILVLATALFIYRHVLG